MSTSCFCCACVQSQNVGIITQFGEFRRLAEPGFQCLKWPLEGITAVMSLRVKQLDIKAETKTKDNVFVTVEVAVQYHVIGEKIYDAYYELTDPADQIRSYVYDVIRGTLPKLELDAAFEAKEQIATAIKDELKHEMEGYGYFIEEALVTDIDPDSTVKAAMNEINASLRLRVAAGYKAEAEKTLQVKAAEADAESKYLSGVGVARQRRAIVDGLSDSIVEFAEEIQGVTPKDVMDLLLLTQYMDVLKEVGDGNLSSTMFLPHGPAAVTAFKNELYSFTAAATGK